MVFRQRNGSDSGCLLPSPRMGCGHAANRCRPAKATGRLDRQSPIHTAGGMDISVRQPDGVDASHIKDPRWVERIVRATEIAVAVSSVIAPLIGVCINRNLKSAGSKSLIGSSETQLDAA